MASVESRQSQAELAICRLVEEASGLDTRFLGPACLASFERVESFLQSVEFQPRGKNFLVASNLVLTKHQLEAIEKRRKDKRKRGEPSFKIVAEFVTEGKKRSLERRPLGELYSSLKDVFELNGVIYICITELKKRSFLRRSLQGCCLSKQTVNSLLASNQLQCWVFGGGNILGTRTYDLLQFDSVLADHHTRFPSLFLRDEGKKRYFKEDDFEKDEEPFGAVVLTKDYHLAGFLNFDRKIPTPVWVGIDSATADTTRSFREIERDLPLGAVGGIYPLIDPALQPKNLIGFGDSGKTTTDNPVELTGTQTAYLNENVPHHSETQPCTVGEDGVNNTDDQATADTTRSFREIERDLPLGAVGGIYPLIDPALQPKNLIGFGDSGKTTTDNPVELTGTQTAYLNENVPHHSETQPCTVGEDGVNNTDDQESTSTRGPSPMENSFRSITSEDDKGTLVVCLPTEKDKERPQDTIATRFPTSKQSSGAQNKGTLIVNLPSKNDKLETSSKEGPQDDLGLFPTTTNRKVPEVPSNDNFQENVSMNDFPDGYDNERRRHTFPLIFDPQMKEESDTKAKRGASVSQVEKRKIKLGDPLRKTIFGRRDLLQRISRSLDKEYKYGSCKCWKDAAEYFHVEEEEYQNFKCSQVHSPTEVMFEYLGTRKPEITIGDLKDGLRKIGRQDVIEVILNCGQADDTLVCSLFENNTDVIGEMAFLLDMQKRGLKNWSKLAAELDIPRKDFNTFETSNSNNPTEKLFEVLKIHLPGLTIRELVRHLEDIERRDVTKAVRSSKKVSENSLVKALMEDLRVMDTVCELLNHKHRTNKVLGWRHLGINLEIDKEILDDLSPPEEDFVSPTEAMINHLSCWKPWLTIVEFIFALHAIARDDVFTVFDGYLPDGCIPKLLKSCSCERCQMSQATARQPPTTVSR